MKKKFTLCLCLCMLGVLGSGLFAQSTSKESKGLFNQKAQPAAMKTIGSNYDFAVSTGTYADLSNPMSVNNGEIWDDPEYKVPIGFTFDLGGAMLDTVYFYWGLGAAVGEDPNLSNPYYIIPFETDLLDRGDLNGMQSESPIGYVLEGSAGSRIFKLEWKNAGFYDELDSLGTMNDSISLQMWLYEGSNVIEYHFGSHQILDPPINYYGETGAYVGLGDDQGTDVFLLVGNPASPTAVDTIGSLDGTPAEGTIYRFTPKAASGLNPDQFVEVKVYPNPSQDLIRVEWDAAVSAPAYFRLFNSLGQVVLEQESMGNRHLLDLSQLQNGVYVLLVESDGKFMRQTVVKQ